MSSRPASLLAAACAALLLAANARADEAPDERAAEAKWAASFPPFAASSYLDDKARVLVAAAGEDTADEADAAARALRTALRTGGRAALVMDAAALGEVITLADERIVKRAARLPVDVIVVVRVFDAPAGPSVVATFYDVQGKTLCAFNVARGTPLAAQGGGDVVGGIEGGVGVSQAAATSVQNVLRDKESARAGGVEAGDIAVGSPADRQFARRRIGFYHYNLFYVNQYGGVVGVSHQLGSPYLGVQEDVLSWPRFFELTGHPGEGRYYKRRGVTKAVLMATGGTVALVGLVLASVGAFEHLVNPVCTTTQDQFGNCTNGSNAPNVPLLVAGSLVFGGGLATLFVGSALSRFESSPSQIIDYAVKYNARLRRELGLPDERGAERHDPPESRREAAPPLVSSVSLAPVFDAHGGGLSLRGSF